MFEKNKRHEVNTSTLKCGKLWYTLLSIANKKNVYEQTLLKFSREDSVKFLKVTILS